MASQNKFANPFNGIELGEDITCGCTPGADCTANFEYSFNEGTGDLTITDKSFLATGDSIVLVTGIQIDVKDQVGGNVAGSGDATAPIVLAIGGLGSDVVRIDYDITTVNGCISSGFLFFNTTIAGQATGSTDPYNDVR